MVRERIARPKQRLTQKLCEQQAAAAGARQLLAAAVRLSPVSVRLRVGFESRVILKGTSTSEARMR